MKTFLSHILIFPLIFFFFESALSSQTIPEPDRSGLFPFVLPWDDSSPGIANISSWLHKPAGKFGTLRAGADGHLYAGKERIRLRGVDITYGSCFPTHEEAEKIAARMAKFGLNIVRFHCMDQNPYPRGLFERSFKNTRDFDPEALERMDYFISVLEKNGIYIYLCTLNYRPFRAADGLPKEIEQAKGFMNQGRHVIGFFNQPIIELQKEFAKKLLTHPNPYTGLRYNEDPAVAFVEINNENGLFQACQNGIGDLYPEPYQNEWKVLWNEWLLTRHGSTEKMRAAWGQLASEAPGQEMLVNGFFSGAVEPWILEKNATGEAEVALSDELPPEIKNGKSLRLNVIRPGTAFWHIRFKELDLKVESERPYTLEFWGKADEERTLDVSVGQNGPPWRTLGMQNTAKLTGEWKKFRFISQMGSSDPAARLIFDPQMKAGSTWIAGVSLRTGGSFPLDPKLRLEDKTIEIVKNAFELTPQAQADWLRFLWDTEDRYWKIMNDYFKNELKVKALVLGTIVGTSTPNLMTRFDAIDTHAYWHHPSPWNTNDFKVGYSSMVSELGALLPNLALRRVHGKPFCITEFGDCSPNTFSSEGDILRAAYAGLQDWDYLSTARYAQGHPFDLGFIYNFIDIGQHPTKMAVLIPAGAMFLRGDVKEARELVCAVIDKEKEIDILRKQGAAWDLVQAGHAGVPHETPLLHKTAILTAGQKWPAGALRPEEVKVNENRIVSDTGELTWDLREKTRGVVTINTPRSKAVVGYSGGNTYELGAVVLEPGAAIQSGWSAITLTEMEGLSFKEPTRWLVTATGYVENSNKTWTVVNGAIIGKKGSWGGAPTLVEGIPARIKLPLPAKQVQAWALDERGQRGASLAVEADAKGNAVLAIGPKYKTIWYEIATQ